MTILKSSLVMLLLTLVMACSSNPPVERQHYSLPISGEMPAAKTDGSAKLLQIHNVQLADFLDTGSLVLQMDDITLNQAKNHLWAEDLRQQINYGLRVRLNQMQQQVIAVSPSTKGQWQLTLEINDFQGRFDGYALTSGQWQLRNAQNEIVQLQSFSFQSPLQTTGYPAMVRALGNNLDQLAAQLSKAISSLK